MRTNGDILFKKAIAEIHERERLGLSTVTFRNNIYWQGDRLYSHLDIETIKKLSWIEFVNDNVMMGPHPNQYRKYDRALTWEEIEAIKDITK